MRSSHLMKMIADNVFCNLYHYHYCKNHPCTVPSIANAREIYSEFRRLLMNSNTFKLDILIGITQLVVHLRTDLLAKCSFHFQTEEYTAGKKKLWHGIKYLLSLDVNFNIFNFKNIYVINKLYEENSIFNL